MTKTRGQFVEPEMEIVNVNKSFVFTGIYADAPSQPCGNHCGTPEEMAARGDECWGLDY